MPSTSDWIDGAVPIPELLARLPQVRPVLDRYGMRGCGGPAGPAETLAFFAGLHDVPLPRLLDELRAAAERPPTAPPPERLADTIYRPFFAAGMLIVLSLGAAWGAYLLLRIGLSGAFTSVGIHEVNAHGHAQIFGWLGLFVMGFAYQAFPRFRHTTLAWPALAVLSFWLMLGGILTRAVGEPLAETWAWAGTAAVVAAWVEVAAVLLFAAILLTTYRRSAGPLAVHDYYILAALTWFVVQAVAEAVYLPATLAAADRAALLALVATWQPALRDLQIHGFALLMVLGVSQRLLPHLYGWPAPSRRLALKALALINAAVVGEALGLVLMRTAGPTWAALWYGSVIVLAVVVAVLVWSMGLHRRAIDPDRSLKFVRAAYGWLLVSLAMLVLLPVYQFGLLARFAPASEAAGIGFSHAYYGAVRHAITVGFLSLMIVGVAAKVVPNLNGIDGRRLTTLWLPFVLLNAGCLLRVVGQTTTDWTGGAFPVAGVSGLLEVAGLAIWAAHLGQILLGWTRPLTAQPADADGPIGPKDIVGEVLDRQPELLDVFVAFGFTPLTSSMLRNTLARTITIRSACRLQGVDVAELLQALNAARTARQTRLRTLPVVEPVPHTCCGH